PSQAASSARQRRARSSLGATTTTVLRETWTSDAHANARAPAVASAILVERRSSRRSARSRNRSLRSASARMPPRRAADPGAVEGRPDGTPAVVHERLRSRDGDPQIAERALSDTRLRGLGVEFQARTLGESVRDLETDVVARVGVPIARITEADDEAIDAWRSAAREEFRQMDQAFSPFYLKDAEKGLHRKRRWGPADAYRSKDTREGPPTGPLAAMRVCRRGARDPGSGR